MKIQAKCIPGSLFADLGVPADERPYLRGAEGEDVGAWSPVATVYVGTGRSVTTGGVTVPTGSVVSSPVRGAPTCVAGDIPGKLRIVVDTAEKHPLKFSGNVVTIPKKLLVGDYSLDGFEDRVMIERKSLDDLAQTLLIDYRRFVDEMDRYRIIGHQCRAIIVEASIGDVYTRKFPHFRGTVVPESLFSKVAQLHHDYDITVMWWRSARECSKQLEMLLRIVHSRLTGRTITAENHYGFRTDYHKIKMVIDEVTPKTLRRIMDAAGMRHDDGISQKRAAMILKMLGWESGKVIGSCCGGLSKGGESSYVKRGYIDDQNKKIESFLAGKDWVSQHQISDHLGIPRTGSGTPPFSKSLKILGWKWGETRGRVMGFFRQGRRDDWERRIMEFGTGNTKLRPKQVCLHLTGKWSSRSNDTREIVQIMTRLWGPPKRDACGRPLFFPSSAEKRTENREQQCAT